MKRFRGRKTPVGCIVELDNEGYITQLSPEKSLQIVNHNPDDFQWGHWGSGPAQLAAAILYEVTEDLNRSRQYYQFFKHDHVGKWHGDTFTISETEVWDWLKSVERLRHSNRLCNDRLGIMRSVPHRHRFKEKLIRILGDPNGKVGEGEAGVIQWQWRIGISGFSVYLHLNEDRISFVMFDHMRLYSELEKDITVEQVIEKAIDFKANHNVLFPIQSQN